MLTHSAENDTKNLQCQQNGLMQSFNDILDILLQHHNTVAISIMHMLKDLNYLFCNVPTLCNSPLSFKLNCLHYFIAKAKNTTALEGHFHQILDVFIRCIDIYLNEPYSSEVK